MALALQLSFEAAESLTPCILASFLAELQCPIHSIKLVYITPSLHTIQKYILESTIDCTLEMKREMNGKKFILVVMKVLLNIFAFGVRKAIKF